MATKKSNVYLNNPSLKAAGVQIEFTGVQLSEYIKCSKDPVYFIENYVKVVSLDKGAILCKLYPYQRRVINAIHNNRMVLSKIFRQAGKSVVVAAYIAWYLTFNDFKTAAILANKGSSAKEIFSRVQFMLESLPKWLSRGVVEWNKTSLELENGSKCFCATSSPSSIRGKSINFLLCVSAETIVKLKNNITGEILELPISEAYNLNIPKVNTEKDVLNVEPNLWSVWTDTGWSEFTGIKKSITSKFIEIKLNSGNTLKGTYGHKLLSNGKWVNIESLKLNDEISIENGSSYITEISILEGGDAYDLVGVNHNSRYFTNGILSHNCDEFAHLAPNLAEEFISSVFPTISSSKESKLVIISTPKGMNAFRKLWVEAEQGLNGFVTCTGHWSEHPDRDQAWADKQKSILGELKFNQEVLCVGKDTMVTIKNKITNKIEIVSIETAMRLLK